jgi:hypothetical protein
MNRQPARMPPGTCPRSVLATDVVAVGAAGQLRDSD